MRFRRAPTGTDLASVWSLVAPIARRQRSRLSLLAVSSIIGGFAEAALLVIIARVAFALASDGADVTVDFGPIHTEVPVTALIAIAAGLVAVRILLQVCGIVLSSHATFRTVQTMRETLIREYLAAAWPLQASQREGRLQELLTTYAGAGAGAIGALTGGAIASFSLAALLLTAVAVNAIASVAAALAALVLGLVLQPLRAASRRRSGRYAEGNLAFATGLTELASTLQEVRVFGVEPQVAGRLERLSVTAANRGISASYVSGSISVLFQGTAMLLVVGTLAVAHAASFSGLASLGAIILILLRSISYAQGVQGSIQGLYECAPYLETLNEESGRYRASAVSRGGDVVVALGDITFDDVSFEYEAGVPVLRNVSFTVPHGEIVGIVGPSGAGKSTLIQLLLRLRDPVSGEIRASGRPVRELSLTDWYRHVTFVPQDARLFAGTVADNIRFFRDGVDTAAIERAARLAHLHPEIAKWPAGYDTPVGERGGQLSGGQRQRLSIARALVEEPDLIVFDEPTSALDVKSESLLRVTMSELSPASSVFIIAHRLSTLSICDRIMVLFDGELQGFDRPDVLEGVNPFYREALQLSGLRP